MAQGAGTSLNHSLSAGLYLNGNCTDDVQNPTEGYDAHIMGKVAGPPGDVGYWKLKGGWTCHLPLRTVLRSIMAKADHKIEPNVDLDGNIDQDERLVSSTPSVTGMALQSSFFIAVLSDHLGDHLAV